MCSWQQHASHESPQEPREYVDANKHINNNLNIYLLVLLYFDCRSLEIPTMVLAIEIKL